METQKIESVLLTTIPGHLRISYNGVSYDKPMSPKAMRILGIALFQAAEETESNMRFMKPPNT